MEAEAGALARKSPDEPMPRPGATLNPAPDMTPVLFIFLDGVGIGPRDGAMNPFLRARLPTLRALLGEVPTLVNPVVLSRPAVSPSHEGRSRAARAFPLDATLGVEGTPQSGTGQISLLTGRNAARIHGHHFGPWPPVRLRPLLSEENLLVRALARGHSVAFANAYPSGFPGARSPRFIAAPPLAARAAGLLTRHATALVEGRAVASEIENTLWQRHSHGVTIPDVSAEAAGENLGRIAAEADLTFFAHYATDQAGHGGRGRTKKEPAGRMVRGVEALERVDRFLAGVLRTLDPGTLLLIASDHGNIEDVFGEHTRNPALGVLAGPGPVRPLVPERLAEGAGSTLRERQEVPGGPGAGGLAGPGEPEDPVDHGDHGDPGDPGDDGKPGEPAAPGRDPRLESIMDVPAAILEWLGKKQEASRPA